jgi:hypothetical protein
MRNVDMAFDTTQWHSVKAPSRCWPNTTEENLRNGFIDKRNCNIYACSRKDLLADARILAEQQSTYDEQSRLNAILSWGEYLETFRNDRSVFISRVTYSREMEIELFVLDNVTM